MKMAEIKTIYKGESVTLLFTFPEAYNMARLASHKVFVGETEFTGVIEGQAIKMQLKSSDTNRMIGTHRIVCLIDDTTLGIRKPYCGDLVVAKTQASGSTTSVSNISDIIIPIVISETAITVGDVMYNYVKGDKGDPFLYSDFTPEQIAELQQPAVDAIASIEAVEQSVEQAEGLRVQAEQARQTNTATAIQNAETATTNANDAATLANEKAGLAETAIIQANDARDGANSAAQSATNLVNSYATDLAAKELKANKQNSLAVDGTGTKFPTVDAVNEELQQKLVSGTNIKTVNGVSLLGSGDVSNLLAEYTHTSNKEIVISSYNLDTDTFTSVGHGLINGDVVAPNLNANVFGITSYSVYIGGMENILYFVINKTDDTFQLSKTLGGSAINLTTNATTDLTKWHFENRVQINISNIIIDKEVKIILTGRSAGVSIGILSNGDNIYGNYWDINNEIWYPNPIYPQSDCGSYVEMNLRISSPSFIRLSGIAKSNVNLNGYTYYNPFNDFMTSNKSFLNITTLNFMSRVFFNGFNIKIYKV